MDIRRLSNIMSGKPTNTLSSSPLLEDDNEIEDGIDVSQSPFVEQDLTETKDFENNSQKSNEEPYEQSEEDEDFDDLEEDDLDSPSIYSQPSTTINHYQSIESAQQGFDIIAGINDIPIKYRDENLIPELVAPSIQYNRFKGSAAIAEWQVKRRTLIRKQLMHRLDFPLDERDIAGYEYINDLLLSRADDGFERKMSNNNLNGVYQENATESAPTSSSRRRGGFFGSMFGNGGGDN